MEPPEINLSWRSQITNTVVTTKHLSGNTHTDSQFHKPLTLGPSQSPRDGSLDLCLLDHEGDGEDRETRFIAIMGLDVN